MPEPKWLKLMHRIAGYQPPSHVSSSPIDRPMSATEKELFKKFGVIQSELSELMGKNLEINYDRQFLYTTIERSLLSPLIGSAMELYADTSCLTGDTKVPLLDGRTLTMRELADEDANGKENWVYSCDTEGQPQFQKIVKAWQQPNQKQTLRIWLDNDEFVEATYDHRFVRRNGEIVQAQQLAVGDSLMPFHRSKTKNGYDLVWDVKAHTWKSVYKEVVRFVFGISTAVLNEGKSRKDRMQIHHKNFTKTNNNPSNLKCLSFEEHGRLHHENYMATPEIRSARATKRNNTYWKSEAGLLRRKELSVERKGISFEQLYGKEKAAEVKLKASLAQSGKTESQEHRDKISSGVRLANETGKRVLTDQGRAAVSSSMSKQWQDNREALLERATKARAAKKCFAPSYNHKITKIESIGLQTVYDLSVGGSELFALDCGIYIHNTNYNSLHNASVWVTSESQEYQNILTKFLNDICVEEKIFDWASQVGTYGDMFVQPIAQDGLGVIAVDDSRHALDISRLDVNGRLIGFYDTPMTANGQSAQGLKKPWEYVHFRLLGTKKRRNMLGDVNLTEYRSYSLLSPDTRRISSKYGTSLITNALAVYKKYKLVEDSIMLSRLSKTIKRYIYKVNCSNTANLEAIMAAMDEYKVALKRSRAIDVTGGGEKYSETANFLSAMEDIILPVFAENGLEIEEIGGDSDVRFIADLEELRNQLAAALRVPLQLLGGYMQEAGGGWPGHGAIDRVDIRFARSCRRLQRALIDGIKRLCQIHLAFKGYDPDPNLFDVHMAETSSAEEEELKEGLDKGIDIVDRLAKFIMEYDKDVEPVELLDYLNKKILKLNDLEIKQLKRKVAEAPKPAKFAEGKEETIARIVEQKTLFNSDLRAHLPIREKVVSAAFSQLNEACWLKSYGGSKITGEKIDSLQFTIAPLNEVVGG